MNFLAFAALLGVSTAEIPNDSWTCRNQIEVWCAADGCAAAAPDETTPLDIRAYRRGGFSICAYSGCWEGEGPPLIANGRLLWTADAARFSTHSDGGMDAAATLLIVQKEGVGFVRVAGLATPLLCERAGPDPRRAADDAG